MSDPTDADQQRAEEIYQGLIDRQSESEHPHDPWISEFVYDGSPQPMIDALAAALADERARTLASCHGRHEPQEMPVLGPGIVTCDGRALQVTYALNLTAEETAAGSARVRAMLEARKAT